MNNETYKFAYCAGYLDGDGCFYIGSYIQKPKNILVYEFSIQVVSVKKEVLDMFCLEFGGYINKKPDKIKHRPAFCWTIKGDWAWALAKQVHSILVDKSIACGFFIQYIETIRCNYWRPVSENIINQRKEFIIKIREDRHMNNFVTKENIDSAKKVEQTIDPSPKDYAYLAGLIDSEGCFRIKKWKPKNRPSNVYAINIEIGNTKLPIIPWLMERFGGHITYIKPKIKKRASATWSLSANALFKILPKIYPFLTSKKSICEKIMEFQETIIPNGGDRHSELFHRLFEKTRNRREVIITEVHNLNRVGS